MPQGPLCAYDGAQNSTDPENSSAVPDSSTPQATVSAAQITRADVADKTKGIGFSGTGFTADEKATVTVVGTDGTEYTPQTQLTVDENGKVNGTYYFSTTEGAQVPVGKYTLFLTDLKTEKDSSKVTFEVVASDADIDDSGAGGTCERPTAPAPSTTSPAPTETPSETQSPTETPTQTPTETPTQTPSETASPTETPTQSPTETQTPPQTPSESPEESPAESEEPTPSETESQPSPTETGTPSETGDPSPSSSEGTNDDEQPAAAPQALIIDPTEITSEDFLNKGVTLGVTGAQPGEKITIVVEHAQGKVDRYTMSKDADDEGKATFGVQAKVKAVLGTYNVRVQAESFDKPQGGSFTVVTNGTDVSEDGNGSGSGGGSGSGDSGSGSSASNDLPRTGAELTGLALGAGLLVVGAAAVVITRRRADAAADDPAEF